MSTMRRMAIEEEEEQLEEMDQQQQQQQQHQQQQQQQDNQHQEAVQLEMGFLQQPFMCPPPTADMVEQFIYMSGQ
jgi:FtsZ-interacting cell division protein YlmF